MKKFNTYNLITIVDLLKILIKQKVKILIFFLISFSLLLLISFSIFNKQKHEVSIRLFPSNNKELIVELNKLIGMFDKKETYLIGSANIINSNNPILKSLDATSKYISSKRFLWEFQDHIYIALINMPSVKHYKVYSSNHEFYNL